MSTALAPTVSSRVDPNWDAMQKRRKGGSEPKAPSGGGTPLGGFGAKKPQEVHKMPNV